MKLLFIFSLLALTACSLNVKEEEKSTTSDNSNYVQLEGEYTGDSNGGGGGCVETTYKIVMVDGKLVWQPEFVACNSGINIFTGCPAPDKGRPWEDNGLQNKEGQSVKIQ